MTGNKTVAFPRGEGEVAVAGPGVLCRGASRGTGNPRRLCHSYGQPFFPCAEHSSVYKARTCARAGGRRHTAPCSPGGSQQKLLGGRASTQPRRGAGWVLWGPSPQPASQAGLRLTPCALAAHTTCHRSGTMSNSAVSSEGS